MPIESFDWIFESQPVAESRWLLKTHVLLLFYFFTFSTPSNCHDKITGVISVEFFLGVFSKFTFFLSVFFLLSYAFIKSRHAANKINRSIDRLADPKWKTRWRNFLILVQSSPTILSQKREFMVNWVTLNLVTWNESTVWTRIITCKILYSTYCTTRFLFILPSPLHVHIH